MTQKNIISLINQCNELEEYILTISNKNQVKDQHHLIMPNKEHTTSLIANNNYYYNFNNANDKLNKVDTLTRINSVLTKSYKAAQSILNEFEESEETDQPNPNFKQI